MRKEYPINGLEQDVIYGRNIYCYLKNNNKIIKWVKRHGNIIAQMLATMGLRTVVHGQNSAGEYEHGFLTNDNRFVERAEAAEIAFKSGQIKIQKTYLFSEDVW